VSAERSEVAVVGGGPAGAATALLLANLGHEIVLLERAPQWRWRACGVFAGPAAVEALRRLGLPDEELAPIAQPVAAMRVESARGASFGLTYGGTGSLADSAVGFDRRGLDTGLLDRAAAAGVAVRLGSQVEAVKLDGRQPRLTVANASGDASTLEPSVVVGADGLRSILGRAAGVEANAPFPGRTALTFHVPTPWSGLVADRPPYARMCVLQDGYIGLAPVPDGRINVGIVLGRSWSDRLRRDGATTVAASVLASVGVHGDGATPLPVLDRVAGIRPVSAAVRRRSGDRWLLVGDAAGFLDPFTGEGIHRALASAELAAPVIHDVLSGRPGASLAAYDGAMRARFRTKDVVSRVVQAFLGHPAIFEYAARRLSARSGIRDTMGRVIGDLEPAGRALDPRFLAALLRP